MAKMKGDDFGIELPRKRLVGCLGLLVGGFLFFCIMCLIVYYYNRSTPVVQENPWINNDSSRPVTDIKELDYNRRLIIYRDEKPRRQLREFEWSKDAQYPFGRGRYEIQAGEGRKLALTLEQIGQIANYEDGTEATTKYRDYWLFLYLCNGINVADFVKLRYRDIVNGEICFVRQKTERTTKTRKEIRVVVTERMQAIINRWGNPSRPDSFIFPILDGQEDAMRRKMKTLYITRAINKRMKEVGEQLGIGNISTYTARHSFATVLKRAGTNIAYISESLGHQDLRTTENYLASFEREERIKNAELLTKF